MTADDIQAYLSEKLPYFMLPNYMQDVEEFPLTPSGKIDYNSLQKQAESVLENRTHRYIPPNTDTEIQLQNIWAEVLRMNSEQISIEDDFSQLVDILYSQSKSLIVFMPDSVYR